MFIYYTINLSPIFSRILSIQLLMIKQKAESYEELKKPKYR